MSRSEPSWPPAPAAFQPPSQPSGHVRKNIFLGSSSGSFLLVLLLALLLAVTTASAQWEIQTAPTTADLRGIDNVGKGIAWASGTEGTVLRTTNDGKDWQRCTTPPDAEHLDFRGIQAFDASTAIVMSSGKGPLSRLYKTTDACQTWTLLFTNPDPKGFWDAVLFTDRRTGYLLGDPVGNRFVLEGTVDSGQHWAASTSKDLVPPNPKIRAFAASNSSLIAPNAPFFGTGGGYLYAGDETCTMESSYRDRLSCVRDSMRFDRTKLPLSDKASSSGIFSLANHGMTIVAVGGDYTKPNQTSGTAALFDPHFEGWFAAETLPHGYRSSVAYDPLSDIWIAVGPNGTDISTDDGRNWRALRPNPALPEPADKIPEDRNWNALSLPFVVGPHGRIGKLCPNALTSPAVGAKP